MEETEIVKRALELTGAERENFVQSACAGNADLFSRVQRQLADFAGLEETALSSRDQDPAPTRTSGLHDSHDGSFEMDSGLNEHTSSVGPGEFSEKSLVVGQNFGPYQLIRPLGAGGMGQVWAAVQSEPVRREVAIKVVKAGISSRDILTRFEAERQALAMMNHPNIARIIDAGATPDGQPWFAMELVQGKPITKYCDENRASVEVRLGLFTEICAAVQHAHQKGIIHRDLKPSNILVAIVDGRPVPKVIDFGLAKAMESTQRLTDQSLFTGIGQILGTLKYMSPEQAGLDSMDIDTRTDIYSLGVILYELLTGTTPLDDASIRGHAALEILALIREKEPVKPSSKLGTSTEGEVSEVTSRRRTDSIRLGKILAGDLDWIVMKALDKDRTRRYESAAGFASDVHRYLNGEPVEARPPSLNYRIRKFVRKNRVGVIAAVTVTAALVLGIIGLAWGLVYAESARRDAVAAREAESVSLRKEIEQRELADEARRLADDRRIESENARSEAQTAAENERAANQQAQIRLTQIEKGMRILTDIFADLDIHAVREGNDPLEAILAKRLVQAADELTAEAVGDPLIVAGLQHQLSTSLQALGYDAEAVPLSEQSVLTRKELLGEDHPDTLVGQLFLAEAYSETGNYEEALPLLEETLKKMKAALGENDPNTLATMTSLAGALGMQGHYERAIPIHENAVARMKTVLGTNHPTTLHGMDALANCYKEVGMHDLCLPLLEETLELRKTNLGEDHYETLLSMNHLALGYNATGQFDKSIPLLEDTLQRMRTVLGDEHPNTLTVLNNLAYAFKESGDPDQALPLFEKALELTRARLGESNPSTMISMNNLASCLEDLSQTDRALSVYEETLRLMNEHLGPDHPNTLTITNNLAATYWRMKRLDKSIPLFETVLASHTGLLGRTHPATLNAIANLGVNYRDDGQLEKAIPLLEEAAAAIPSQPSMSWIRTPLRNAYVNAGMHEEFSSMADEMLESLRQTSDTEPLQLAGALTGIGEGYLTLNDLRQAEKLLQECIEIRLEHDPESWLTHWTSSLLGRALMRQDRLDDAESFLRSGTNGLIARQDSIPPGSRNKFLTESIDDLIDLYTRLNKSDEVEKWKAERTRITESIESTDDGDGR